MQHSPPEQCSLCSVAQWSSALHLKIEKVPIGTTSTKQPTCKVQPSNANPPNQELRTKSAPRPQDDPFREMGPAAKQLDDQVPQVPMPSSLTEVVLRNKDSRSLLPMRLQMAAVLSTAEAFTSLLSEMRSATRNTKIISARSWPSRSSRRSP